jgi:hypothetical protein
VPFIILAISGVQVIANNILLQPENKNFVQNRESQLTAIVQKPFERSAES